MVRTIQHAGRGDARARERVVESLTSRVDSCSRYYARVAGADVDDLRQEMWLGILRALESVDVTIGDPSQYLLQQGRFALLTYLRRERRPRSSVPLEAEPVAFLSVEDEAVTSRAAGELIEGLGDAGRQIVGFLLDGHTRSDVARIMSCSPANVTYHLRRVEARLGSMLDGREARSA